MSKITLYLGIQVTVDYYCIKPKAQSFQCQNVTINHHIEVQVDIALQDQIFWQQTKYIAN